jgi:phosphoglycolate phosphatase
MHRPARPPQIRAVVYDLDGTLLDSRSAVVEAVAAGVRDVLERHGIVAVPPDPGRIRDAMGLPAPRYFRSILPGNLHHLADEVQAAATRLEVEALAEGRGRLYPGAAALLHRLHEAGARQAVISNAQAPYFRAAVEHLGLTAVVEWTECFEDIPASSDDPKRVLLTRALEQMAADAAETLMVGDRREDIAAGRALGCMTVGVTHGFGQRGELDLADHVFDRLESIAELLETPSA